MIFRSFLAIVLAIAFVQFAHAQPGFSNGPGFNNGPSGASRPGMGGGRPGVPNSYRPPTSYTPPSSFRPPTSSYTPSTPSFPNTPTFPNTGSNFSPNTTPYTPPSYGSGYEMVYECSNCKKEVSQAATKCPHCGVRFGSSSVGGRGMGRLIGWDVIEVEGATGYLDTDYAAKGRAAIETLQRDDVDFLVVHVEATDEASHEGETAEKVKAVENIDRHIVGPVHEWLKSQGDYRLLICPDHPTFLRTRTHSHGYCPFAMCGTGIPVNPPSTYDEVAAAQSDLVFDEGHKLMGHFLNS